MLSMIVVPYFDRYEGNPDAFRARAQACVAEWKSRRFDPPASQQDAEDPHYLTFSPFDPDTHGPIIKAMVEKVRKQRCQSICCRVCIVHFSFAGYSCQQRQQPAATFEEWDLFHGGGQPSNLLSQSPGDLISVLIVVKRQGETKKNKNT